MPARYQIFPERRLKYVKVWGETNLKDFMDAAEAYFEDPGFNTDNRYLVDLSNMAGANVKFWDAMTLYGYYKRKMAPYGKPFDVAIAAPSDSGYGISRMFSALASSGKVMRVKIFNSPQEASEWLDVSDFDYDRIPITSGTVATI